MPSNAAESALLRVSTRDLPLSERLPFLREVFGRQVARVDIEPMSDEPIDYEATLLGLPGLRVLWSEAHTPARWTRTAEFVRDGNDDFLLSLQLDGTLLRSQRGLDLDVGRGEAAGILHTEPASIRFDAVKCVAVMLPRTALSPLVRQMEDAATQLIRSDTEAMSLLRSYVSLLRDNANLTDPALGGLMATHVHDLVAMALGASPEGKEIALGRGVRAARLRAIKLFAIENCHSQGLSVGAVAGHFKLTTRYIQMMFEGEGVTFSSFVLEQRLRLARRMLRNAAYDGMSISAIAFAAGFSDLSHFNRSFRRHFGAKPSDVRMEHARARYR